MILPYQTTESSKKEQVAQMFDNISPRYDLLNRILSLGIDVYWRKKAVAKLKKEQAQEILDIATGTADFAISIYENLKPKRIVGVDISEGMLAIGREKIRKQHYHEYISLQTGDSENLPFETETFEAVTAAFGVRNFENLEKGLKEMHRVLKKGSKIVILEFSQPESFPFKQIYFFYFQYILPFFGKLISKDNRAYTYLPESVKAFPYGKDFVQILEKVGFQNLHCEALTFGIASIYVGEKQ